MNVRQLGCRRSRGRRTYALTKHLPRFDDTVKVMKNRSRGWSKCTSAPLPDSLRVKHRSNGCLMRCCSANTSNSKVPEVYTELPSLNIRIMFPVNVVRYSQLLDEPDGTYLSRAARRVFSSENDCSGDRVLSDRTLFCLACADERLSVLESSRTPSGSK